MTFKWMDRIWFVYKLFIKLINILKPDSIRLISK